MKLHISKNFTLPESVITETLAVLGIRGSGKTTTAKVIVEETLSRKRQVVIIDPTDAWWGLKSGFKIITFGGSHGDLPLNEDSGKLIADFVVDNGVSCILSLRHLRKSAQKRLACAFNEQIYFRKGETKNRTPLLLVIDECDTFIPQKVMGEDAKSVGAVEDLVRRGRNAGIGVCLISQRAASINKDVLTQLTVLIAHKHTSPQDRKALLEWIRGHDTEDRAGVFLDSLASLPVGSAWFWSPDMDVFEKVVVRQSDTFDSSATPKLGSTVASPKSLKKVDLELLKEKMADAVQQAEDNNPTKLKEKVKKLEKEISNLRLSNQMLDAKKIKEVVKKIEVPIISAKERSSLFRIEKLLEEIKKRCPVEGFANKYVPLPAPLSSDLNILRSTSPAKDLVAKVYSEGKTSSGGLQKIINTLAHHGRLSKVRLAVLSGFKHSAGSFNTYLSNARSKGLIEGSQELSITPAGIALAGPVDLGINYNWWADKLGGKQGEILKFLCENYPVAFTKNDLGKAVNTISTGGSFNTYLSNLRSYGLIEGTQLIKASENLSAQG